MKSKLVTIFIFLCMIVFCDKIIAQDTGVEQLPPTQSSWIISPPPSFQLAQPTLLHYDPSVIPGAQMFPMHIGDRASIAGVLFNEQANAWLIAQYTYIQQYWITEMDRRVELTINWSNAEIAGAHIRSETENSVLNLRVSVLQSQNNILVSTTEHLIRENRRQQILYRFLFSSTALAVIAAGTGAVVMITK